MVGKKPRTEVERLASKGGKARARALTAEERRRIAVAAAESRWGKKLPVAQYPGTLKIGDLEFDCAVLSDGKTRLITQSDFMEGMGMYYSGWVAKNRSEEDRAADTPHFLSFKSLKPYVDRHLGDLPSIIIKYRNARGNVAHGIRAEIIPKICDVWIDADEEGTLGARQKQIAAKARILMRALAHVGIVALVDEATGFQAMRDQDALAKYLEQYVTKEFRQWVRTFPRSFFRELCRLKGVPFPEDMRLPRYFGHIINDVVYDRLAPGLRRALEGKNPTEGPNNRRRKKHHQMANLGCGEPPIASSPWSG